MNQELNTDFEHSETASYYSLSEALEQSKKDDEEFCSQLKQFPNTFQLEHMEKTTMFQLQRIRVDLLEVEEYDSPTEKAEAKNLLAYCTFMLKEDNALSYLDEVFSIEGQENNLVTLANKAFILRKTRELSQADDVVARLNNLSKELNAEDFEYLIIRAKAEMAYTYTRLGPGFGSFAINIFEQVIPKAKEHDIWLWKFGLALSRKRMVLSKYLMYCDIENEIMSVFAEITKQCTSPNLVAKAYAEKAFLHFRKFKSTNNSYEKRKVRESCEKALEIDDNDRYVLFVCGKLYRYLNDLKKSIELLEKSVRKKPTSLCHYHLGLSYKNLAFNNQKYVRAQAIRQSQTRDPESLELQLERLSLGMASKAQERAKNNSSDISMKTLKGIIKPVSYFPKKFSQDDPTIQKAVHHLELAVKIVIGTNAQATYDLALVQFGLEKYDQAIENLKKIICGKSSDILLVNAYELYGCILRSYVEKETDATKKAKLDKQSYRILSMALRHASKSFSQSEEFKNRIGEIWQSFPLLYQCVDESPATESQELLQKARLFQLIRDYQSSHPLLELIQKEDPSQLRDKEFVKVKLDNFLKNKDYFDACNFIEILPFEWKDLNIPLAEIKRIHIEAGCQILLEESEVDLAKSYFTQAINLDLFEYEANSDATGSSLEDIFKKDCWDVMLLWSPPENKEKYDLEQSHYSNLKQFLVEDCHLKVSDMKNGSPTKCDLESSLRVLKRSCYVLYMCGEQVPHIEMRYMLNNAVKDKDMNKVMTISIDPSPKRPEMLKNLRNLDCLQNFFEENVDVVTKIDCIRKMLSFILISGCSDSSLGNALAS